MTHLPSIKCAPVGPAAAQAPGELGSDDPAAAALIKGAARRWQRSWRGVRPAPRIVEGAARSASPRVVGDGEQSVEFAVEERVAEQVLKWCAGVEQVSDAV